MDTLIDDLPIWFFGVEFLQNFFPSVCFPSRCFIVVSLIFHFWKFSKLNLANTEKYGGPEGSDITQKEIECKLKKVHAN